MDIRTYLDRIGYDKSVRPDLESLFGLHRTHLLTVPFENLDIHLGTPIQLNEGALWDKIVIHRRGGFCYELNGMFAWLLRQIGFEVTYLNGRVYNSVGKLGQEFDHLALLVRTSAEPQYWLADVGFGDSFFEPLKLAYDGDQTQGLRAYRIEPFAGGYDLLRRDFDGKWSLQYFFDLQPRKFPFDYEAACLYHQTSPKSSFTRELVISLAMPDGRISLDIKNLTITTNGKRIKQPVRGEDEFRNFLGTHFEIKL
jgi:N-hydroxyarylamine O-acetyltransferase